MSKRDYIKEQIDILPETALENVIEFISFQKYSLGMAENESDYLNSIPGMADKIINGMNTPISDCVPLDEVWSDV